jgi:hypothetical protein
LDSRGSRRFVWIEGVGSVELAVSDDHSVGAEHGVLVGFDGRAGLVIRMLPGDALGDDSMSLSRGRQQILGPLARPAVRIQKAPRFLSGCSQARRA